MGVVDGGRISGPFGRGTQSPQEQHPPHLKVHHHKLVSLLRLSRFGEAALKRIRCRKWFIVKKNQSVDRHVCGKLDAVGSCAREELLCKTGME